LLQLLPQGGGFGQGVPLAVETGVAAGVGVDTGVVAGVVAGGDVSPGGGFCCGPRSPQAARSAAETRTPKTVTRVRRIDVFILSSLKLQMERSGA
jgi:hypothetical protein